MRLGYLQQLGSRKRVEKIHRINASNGANDGSLIDSSSLDPICNESSCSITSMTYTVASVTAPTAAPEIDPVSATSALTLLFGGLAVLRGRKRLA
jgi:hypothetical protein